MPKLPIKVQNTLKRMKKEHEHYVEVKIIHGLYCVFESRGVYDKALKRTKKVTHYLGRILGNGTFVEAKHRKQTSLPAPTPMATEQQARSLDEYDKRILTALSMNARATYAFIGNLVGLPKNTVYSRVKRLEKVYRIRYTAEIDIEKLGYLKFLILVKFFAKVPSNEEIRNGLLGYSRVQFAVSLTGGDYDLLIYVLSESNTDVNILSREILSNSVFIEYPAEWHTMPFYETNNFVPPRDEFIATFGEVFERRKGIFEEGLTEKRKTVLRREFAVLNELNRDGKTEFADIDKKYGFDRGRAQYSYYKLLQSKLLVRTTLSLESLPLKYIGLFFVKVVSTKEFLPTRQAFLEKLIEDTGRPTNKYSLVGDIGSPYGAIMFLPVYEEEDIDRIKKELLEINGIETDVAIATGIAVGRMVYRRFDNTYSIQTRILTDTYGIKTEQQADYLG